MISAGPRPIAQVASGVDRGVGPGVARSQDPSQRRAGPAGAVVGERHDRMESEATLVIRCRGLLLGMGRHQGRIEVDDEVIPDLGQRPSGQPPGRGPSIRPCRAIPAIAVASSRARSPMIRETVGSDATFPNRCGRARSITRSAGQSPPAASITARSQIALPGRWTAHSWANPSNSTASDSTRPRTRVVSVSRSIPAFDTEPDYFDRYLTYGSQALAFISEVPLFAGVLTCRKASYPSVSRHFHHCMLVSKNISMKSLG